MAKRKTRYLKKTVKKQAGKKIVVSEKGLTEEILVRKKAETPNETPTETPIEVTAKEAPSKKLAETTTEMPNEVLKETSNEVSTKLLTEAPASDAKGLVTQQEKVKEQRKKNDATLKLEKELVKDRRKLKRKNKKEKTHIPLWTKIVIVALSSIIVLMIGVAIFGYMLLSHTANVFKGNPMDILIGTELAKDENNLTNVLIFGTSEDADGHGGGLLTDSILVASVDQGKKTSKIFSIPRDLWVNYTVPGGETMNCVVGTQGKINATYMCALDQYKNNKDQASRYFAKKISEITGLNLQYYVSLDWSALRTLVDELGGIDVDVYADDEAGIHDSCQHLDLPRGMNYGLNGSMALKLARARNAGCDGGGDFGLSRSNFDREINQQRIFNAIKNKAFSLGVLAKPTKVIRLIDSLGNNVKTNITMAEVRTLIEIATNLNGEVESIPTVEQFGVGRIGIQSVVLPNGASTYSESSMFSYGDFQRYLRKKLINTE